MNSDDDTVLLLRALRCGKEIPHERVDTPEAMETALGKRQWDLIIADYSMPYFSGPAALALATERASDLPFILISGVVNEETAVEAMRAGADDYFSKEPRAAPAAVERELHKAGAPASRSCSRSSCATKPISPRVAARSRRHLAPGHQHQQGGWSDRACRSSACRLRRRRPGSTLLNRCMKAGRTHRLVAESGNKQFQDLRMIRADG
jgi:CheY-like chemotaxis protein